MQTESAETSRGSAEPTGRQGSSKLFWFGASEDPEKKLENVRKSESLQAESEPLVRPGTERVRRGSARKFVSLLVLSFS